MEGAKSNNRPFGISRFSAFSISVVTNLLDVLVGFMGGSSDGVLKFRFLPSLSFSSSQIDAGGAIFRFDLRICIGTSSSTHPEPCNLSLESLLLTGDPRSELDGR